MSYKILHKRFRNLLHVISLQIFSIFKAVCNVATQNGLKGVLIYPK